MPSIDTKNVITQIAVNNGDTAVIGGIYEETISNDVTKVPFLGDIPILGYLFKTTGTNEREDRAPDLPDAAHRQGIGHRGEVTAVASARRARRPRRGASGARRSSHYNAPVHLHRGNLFLVGLPGARQVDARAPARASASASAFVDADGELERGSAYRSRRSSKSRARRGSAIARRRSLAELVAAHRHRARHRRRRRAARRRTATRLKENGTVLYLHATPETLWERTRRSRHRPLLQAADPLRAARRSSTRCATRCTARSPTASSSPTASRSSGFAQRLEQQLRAAAQA